MALGPSEERIKPFRLVKYVSLSSLVILFIGAVVLSVFSTHWARSMQQRESEQFARLLIENLNHQIFLQFMLPVLVEQGQIQLSKKDQFERMDRVVRSTLHSFQVETVTIYGMNNTVSYSFQLDMVGKQQVGGKGYLDALEGTTSSRIEQRGSMLELLLGFPKLTRLATIAPLRAERQVSRLTGPIMGVIEIVQDLSEEHHAIFRLQISVIITITVVLSTLFLVLLFFVRRGEAIIEARAQERMRLVEQLQRAEHLSSLGEMVASVSHEIRNPLGIIMSSAELLKRKLTQMESKNSLPDVILEESGRLSTIISDFLNYARPRTPDWVFCRIDEILEKNLTFLAPQIERQGYRIHFGYYDLLPEVQADATMLYQAFLNILINSMQAMPEGGDIHIDIEEQNQNLHIAFLDHGSGIPSEVMEKIWDPFFTTKESGTGLGLGIVKNIIEAHGGQLRITNRPSGGAEVTIILPLFMEH